MAGMGRDCIIYCEILLIKGGIITDNRAQRPWAGGSAAMSALSGTEALGSGYVVSTAMSALSDTEALGSGYVVSTAMSGLSGTEALGSWFEVSTARHNTYRTSVSSQLYQEQ